MEPSITRIEKGDQGGPAIYALGNNQKGRKYLSGIATFDLKNGLPPKYVRIIHFVNIGGHGFWDKGGGRHQGVTSKKFSGRLRRPENFFAGAATRG